jgi:hypothetical protein
LYAQALLIYDKFLAEVSEVSCSNQGNIVDFPNAEMKPLEEGCIFLICAMVPTALARRDQK